MSFFKQLQEVPEDAIFGLGALYHKDKRADKINLVMGVYRDEKLLPVVLQSVREAERILWGTEREKEYLPIGGNNLFLSSSSRLLFGESLAQKGDIFSFQSIGGTGALHIGGQIIKSLSAREVHISMPTWANHEKIFSCAGHLVRKYPYYDREKRRVVTEELLDHVSHMPLGGVLVLHACCHNPTGLSLSHNVWKQLAALIKQREILPFFDVAYQGFGKGMEEDVWPVRYFAEEGLEFMVAHSFSKMCNLYGERVGALHIFSRQRSVHHKIKNVASYWIRGSYSNPPRHGAAIVALLCEKKELFTLWQSELSAMRERIRAMRGLLATSYPMADNSYILAGEGMFCLLPLSVEQVESLRERHAIYMPQNGRINMAGLNEKIIKTVIAALKR